MPTNALRWLPAGTALDTPPRGRGVKLNKVRYFIV